MRLIDAEQLSEHKYIGVKYDRTIDDGIAKTEGEVFAFQCGWNEALISVAKFAPTVDAVEVVRCKDCRWGREACGNIECVADMNVPPEYHGYDWFCPNGERREDDAK